MNASPFDGDGVWLRCALHAHTTESDGDLPPRELAAAYAEAGYDVLAVTDHWRLTRTPSAGRILGVPASELSCDLGAPGRVADVLVYGLREIPDDPGGDRRNWMVNEEEHWEQRTFASPAAAARFAREQGAASFLAHPYWTGVDPVELDAEDLFDGIEVYNAGCEHESGRGDSSAFWDAGLERGLPLACIAADDAHVAVTDIGHASTWVRAAERSPEAVVDALRTGRSYASSGPLLHELHRDGTTVAVSCSPCRLLVLQMEREQGVAVVARDGDPLITHAELHAPDAAAYVRLRAVDAAGRSAWSNVL
jgi:hypothetical protein